MENIIGKTERYLVQTRSSGIKLPEIHGVSKNLDPNVQPEKQNIKPLKGNFAREAMDRSGKSRNEKNAPSN